MSSEKTTAIVLKVVEFSETSSVVTLFTREFGKVRALAKGARRPKGAFESALDLLAVCRIVFLRKSSDSLDLLTEAKLERWFRPPGGNLSNLYAAYYVAELLNELTDDYDSHPKLFDAADETLVALAGPGQVAAVLVRFELTALRELGHLPSLATCGECGTAVKPAGRVPFSQLAGGVLCDACRVGQKQIISISAGVLDALARFSEPNGDDWRRIEMDQRTYGELRGVLNHYWTHLLGHPPRMHRWLSTAAR
ncbi:MAG: DNA repair protein RecO [Pirellulales bacterium]